MFTGADSQCIHIMPQHGGMTLLDFPHIFPDRCLTSPITSWARSLLKWATALSWRRSTSEATSWVTNAWRRWSTAARPSPSWTTSEEREKGDRLRVEAKRTRGRSSRGKRKRERKPNRMRWRNWTRWWWEFFMFQMPPQHSPCRSGQRSKMFDLIWCAAWSEACTSNPGTLSKGSLWLR